MMKRFLLYRLLPVLIPLMILGGMRIFALPSGCESCTDVYWHIHAADRPFSAMTAKSYPVTLSIWRDHFADKEFLFHVLLKGYTGLKRLFSSPLEPPFTGAGILLLLLFLISFVYAGVRAGIPDRMLLLCSLGVALFTPLFTYRLLMIRPHVLSMTLMMFACGILFSGPGRWRNVILMFGMGWLYAWSYSTPHLLLITAFGFGVAYFPVKGIRSFLSVLSSAAGIFCGLLIHPQSPNTFILWKLQGIDALLTPTTGLGAGVIPIARELHPPATLWLVTALPVFVLLYIVLMMWNRLREQNGLKQLSPECTACALLAFLWMTAACMISLRPVEYALPMLFLALGVLFPKILNRELFRPAGRPVVLWILLTAYLLSGVGYTIFYSSRSLSRASAAPVEFVSVLKTAVKPGERVINIDWSDFPPLVFLAPEYEYTWGLDPMFSFTPFPKRSTLLGKLSRPVLHSSRRIRSVFQADYAVLLRRQNVIGKNLQEHCGWQTVYDGPDGWIFKLAED